MSKARKAEDFSAVFNKFSNKIVNMREYGLMEKMLLKQERSGREKLFAAVVDLPYQFVTAPKFLLQESPTTYTDVSFAPTLAETYVSAEDLARTEVSLYKSGFNKKFQEKALKCRLQALEACVDHSARVRSGELRPFR